MYSTTEQLRTHRPKLGRLTSDQLHRWGFVPATDRTDMPTTDPEVSEPVDSTEQHEQPDPRGSELAQLVVDRLKILGLCSSDDSARVLADLESVLLDRCLRFEQVLLRQVAQAVASHAQQLAGLATGATGGAIVFRVVAHDAAAVEAAKAEQNRQAMAAAADKVTAQHRLQVLR